LGEYVSKREEMAKYFTLFSRYQDIDILRHEASGKNEQEIVEAIYQDLIGQLRENVILTSSQVELVKGTIHSYRQTLLKARSVKESSKDSQREFLQTELNNKFGVEVEGDFSLLESKTFEISMVFSLNDADFQKIAKNINTRAFHVQTENGLLVIVSEHVAKGDPVALERTIIHEETHAINAFMKISRGTSDFLLQAKEKFNQGDFEGR
jgi:hypothetical protein